MQGSKPSEETEESHASDSDDNESESDIQITRRDALIGTIAAGLVKSFGTGTVTADEEEDIDLSLDTYEDEQEIYRQFEGGNLDEFTLQEGEDPLMSVDYEPMNDDYIVGEVAMRINHGDYETFGSAREDNIDNRNGGTIYFTGEELWGDSDYVTEDGAFDFEGLEAIEEDYANLNVEDPEEDPANETVCELRFRFVSSHGSLTKEETIEFTLGIGIPLGFGQRFGKNFGRNHVERWPSDWDDDL